MQIKSREYWSESEVLQEAIVTIRHYFGLRLSIIERKELREYVAPALDGRDQIEFDKNLFDPISEVVDRFMMNYYELPFALAHVHTSRDEGSELYQYNREEFKHYLQRQQYRMHNPLAFQEDI